MGGVHGRSCCAPEDDGDDAENVHVVGTSCLFCQGDPEHEDEPDSDEEGSDDEGRPAAPRTAPLGVVWGPVPGMPPTFGVVPGVQAFREDSLLSSSTTVLNTSVHLSRVADLAQCMPPPLGTGPLRATGCSSSSSVATACTLPPCWEQREAGAQAPSAAAAPPSGPPRRHRTDPQNQAPRGASARGAPRTDPEDQADPAALSTRMRRQSAPSSFQNDFGNPRRSMLPRVSVCTTSMEGSASATTGHAGVLTKVSSAGDIQGEGEDAEEMVTPRVHPTTAKLLSGTPDWGGKSSFGALKTNEASPPEPQAQAPPGGPPSTLAGIRASF